MNELLTKDELSAIEYRRNVMGGFISYASKASSPAFINAFDDSEKMQKILEAIQKEVVALRERVEVQRGMIKDLLDDLPLGLGGSPTL